MTHMTYSKWIISVENISKAVIFANIFVVAITQSPIFVSLHFWQSNRTTWTKYKMLILMHM